MPAAETELTDELLERVRSLSPAAKDRLRDELDADDDNFDLDTDAFGAELIRRIESVKNGTAVLLTREEAEAEVRAHLKSLGIEV